MSNIVTKEKISSIHDIVADEILQTNQLITNLVAQDIPLIANITNHITSSGGKRLRPRLTLVSSKLCGFAKTDEHIKLAAAVELIHTATLLHDDVVDDSSLRRGDKTANVIWSNQTSVLVGDFLLSKAFQLMVETQSIEALSILSDASAKISRGEIKQLEKSYDFNISYDEYIDIISSKTATLFSAATEIGAVISDNEKYRNNLKDFGLYLGIAFQIIDDILDYEADQEDLGKSIGDDFSEGKITLPLIIIRDEAEASQAQKLQQIMNNEIKTQESWDFTISLLHKIDALKKSRSKAKYFLDKARDIFNNFEKSQAKEEFSYILDFCESRIY